MKFATLAALVATAATASAKVFLGPINDQITEGSTVNVEWMVDCDETLHMLLVKETSSGWSKVDTIFKDVHAVPIDGSYEWHVGTSYPEGNYALWISSQNYADITPWFTFVDAH